MKLTPRLTLIFVLYAAALLVSIDLLAYTRGRSSLRSATISELQATSIEKEAALNAWVGGYRTGITLLAANPTIIESAAVLAAAAAGSPEALAAHDRLVAAILPRVVGGEFLDISFIDPQSGEILASSDPEQEGRFKEDRPYFIQGKTGPYVQNLYFSMDLYGPAMTAAAPLRAADGQLLGVLSGRLNLDEMNTIINRRTGLRQTDDEFLVNSSNLFVTQPRFVPDPAVLQLGIHTVAVNRCLNQETGVVEGDDYRGVPSIIVHRWLPERSLCLIVKMDQSEAYGPAHALGRFIASLSVLALLIASGLALALAHSITRPVRALQSGAERFGMGELNVRLSEDRRDELGNLARAFNRMAASLAEQDARLRAYAVELEARVEARAAELKQSEERLSRVTEASPNALIMAGRDGRISFANQTASALLGYTPAELLGMAVESLIPERFRVGHPGLREGFFSQPRQRAMGEGRDLFALRRDGSEAPVEIGLSPVETRDGLFTLATITDISKRKQAEDQLARSMEDLRRSNAELERFAYVASHDLQEPLRMITSYLQLLERKYRPMLEGDAIEYIDYAVDGSIRMKSLISDLLSYSRVGTRGKDFARVECEALLADALRNLQIAIDESQARITHTALPAVMADDVQLTSLFQNLIANAIKFRSEKPPEIHIGVQPEGKHWVFSVRDNGIGIDPQYFERVFIIFQRLHTRQKYSGTGIGLAISKRIVERHGGRIWIESQPGQGTTFYFTLPIMTGESHEQHSQQPAH